MAVPAYMASLASRDQGRNITQMNSDAKMRLKAIIGRPALRKVTQDDEDGHIEDWIELLGDLIFVAALFKAGDVIKICGHLHIPSAVLFVTMVWRVLWSLTMYINAFKSNDVLRLFLMSVILVGTFTMVLNYNNGGNQECLAYMEYVYNFTSGYVATRVVMMILYGMVMHAVPESRQKLYPHMACTGLAVVIILMNTIFAPVMDAPAAVTEMFSSASSGSSSGGSGGTGGFDVDVLGNPSGFFAGLFLTQVVEMFPLLLTAFQLSFDCQPMTRWFVFYISHYMGRQGVVAMLCMGEGFISLLIPRLVPAESSSIWTFRVAAFVVLHGLALLHYDCIPHDIDQAVLRVSPKWVGRQELMYWFLYPSLFLLSVAYKIQLEFLLANVPVVVEEEMFAEQEIHARRLAGTFGTHPDWTEVNSVGMSGLMLMVCMLLLLGIEAAQRREEMWHTQQAMRRFAIRAGVAVVGNLGYWLLVLIAGWKTDIIKADNNCHALIVVLSVFLGQLWSHNEVEEVQAQGHDSQQGQDSQLELQGHPPKAKEEDANGTSSLVI